MAYDKDRKDEKPKIKKPLCTGCGGDAPPPTHKQDWCTSCWPARLNQVSPK